MPTLTAISIAQQLFNLCKCCQYGRRSNVEKLNVACMCTVGGCAELADIYADCISAIDKEPCERNRENRTS